VGTLSVADTWRMEDRSRLVSLKLQANKRAPAEACSPKPEASIPEPSRLLAPVEMDPAELSGRKLLARYEAVEWWLRGFGAYDLAVGWTHGGLACVEVTDAGTKLRGWLD